MTTAEIARRVLIRNLGKPITVIGRSRRVNVTLLESDLRAESVLGIPLREIREIYPGTMSLREVDVHRRQYGPLTEL